MLGALILTNTSSLKSPGLEVPLQLTSTVFFSYHTSENTRNSTMAPETEVTDLVAELEAEYDAAIDLTKEDEEDVSPERSQSPLPQPRYGFGNSLDQFICEDGLVVKPGMTVELSEPLMVTGFAAPFLKITTILDNGNGGASLRGIPFVRTRHLPNTLPRKLNELCMLVLIDAAPPDSPVAVDHDVSAAQMLRVRELRLTNSAFPEHRYNNHDMIFGKVWVSKFQPSRVSMEVYIDL